MGQRCLAQGSYIIGHEGWAFIIDPRRDIGEYLLELDARRLRLKGVLLTHLHADFVSGNEELRKQLGATVFIGANAGALYPHYPVCEGDTLALSTRYALRALETPGHTPGCISWLLIDKSIGDKPLRVFTGDTLFVGSVGRPDLVGSVGLSAEHMATLLFQSLDKTGALLLK